MLVHVLTKLGSDRAIFYLFMTFLLIPTYIPFLPLSLQTSHGQAHSFLYLITNLQTAINCCIRGSEGGDTESIYRAFYFVFFLIDVCIRQCMSGNACVRQHLLIRSFHCCLFISLNSFSDGCKYLLQRNSVPVAIKWGVYYVQIISGSIVNTKWVFLTIREIG